jgi:phospholipid transport system substrate-binding protein
MKKWCCTFAALAILTQVGFGADPNTVKPAAGQDPPQILRTTLDRVLAVLRNKGLAPEVRDKQVSEIITPVFDFPTTARLSLGKEQWSKLTPAQQKRFTDLFVKRIKDTYRDKLAQYTDEKVVLKPAVSNEGKIRIPTEVVTKEKTFAIVYHFYRDQSNKVWRIYDVEIEGISMIRTYRSQFDEVLAKGTIDDLLKQLEQQPQDPNSPKR